MKVPHSLKSRLSLGIHSGWWWLESINKDEGTDKAALHIMFKFHYYCTVQDKCIK